MKTLRQISEKYNITRQGLIKRIKKIPKFRQKYMMKKKGMWLISDKAIHLINHKRQMVRPKHYKQSIDHVPTRYDLQQALKHEQVRNDKLLEVVKSQQRTIKNQSSNQRLLLKNYSYNKNNIKEPHKNPRISENRPVNSNKRKIQEYRRHGRVFRFFHNI